MTGWRGWYRRHERALAAGWLLATLAFLVTVAFAPVRARALAALQAGLDRWDARWTARLAEGERLLRTGQAARAESYLARLDRIFPARSVRHGRDKERERLLLQLARSQEAMGRRGRTMETYARLVAFDSLNYLNYYETGAAAERLLSGWAIAPEARDAYAAALALLPSHLPSLRGYLGYYLDRGEFIPVVEGYQRYLDAFLVHWIDLRLGDSTVLLPVMADGREQRLTVPVRWPAGWTGTLVFAAHGFPLAVDSIVLSPALVVGRVGRGGDVSVPASAARPSDLEPAENGAFRPTGPEPTLAFAVGPLTGPVSQVRLVLRAFKPLDAALWAGVARSYRNLLDEEGLARARARTVTLRSAEEADQALARQPWARAGRLLRDDEHPF